MKNHSEQNSVTVPTRFEEITKIVRNNFNKDVYPFYLSRTEIGYFKMFTNRF